MRERGDKGEPHPLSGAMLPMCRLGEIVLDYQVKVKKRPPVGRFSLSFSTLAHQSDKPIIVMSLFT